MAGTPDSPTLRRALGRWDLTAIGVNQVIGSAIFLLPADVARLVGPWGPLAFIGVGLLSLSIALCFAEVGSRFEKTGGPYLPARAAFGRFIGFEVGWMMWFTRVTSQASVANGWLDEDRAILETLHGFKRAGCAGVLTYFAPKAARLLGA